MGMYHQSYHPLSDVSLANILFGLSDEEKEIVIKQVKEATEKKLRNYRVTIVEKSQYDDGMWFEVDNGIVIGAQDIGRK